MIYKNIDIHNVCELYPCKNGGVRWSRVPENVYDNLSGELGRKVSLGSTGVELRFVIKSGDSVKLTIDLISKMSSKAGFQVYYGAIQGDSEECEVYNCCEPKRYTFEIKKPNNLDVLKKISKEYDMDWDPEVIRVIFDRGQFSVINVEGDAEPPKKEQLPKKTLLTYGSSITHGSVAIDTPHTWASCLAHSLNMDLRNLGMAGSCALEPEFAEYIASEGEKNHWDMALLELGINNLDWDCGLIQKKSEYFIKEIAERNPHKQIYVISPFYCFDDYTNSGKAEKWRAELKGIVQKGNYAKVSYIDGSEILDNISLLAAGCVHPNIYGVHQIADRLYNIISEKHEFRNKNSTKEK